MATAVRSLDPQLAEIALINCNERAEVVNASIAVLKEWIKKTPHLKARCNDQLLVTFLRRCNYNLEDTKKRIDSFYSLKSVFPEVLCSRALNESLMALYRKGVHIIPTKPICGSGVRIIISRFSKVDPKKTNPREAFKLLFILLEMLANEDDYASISGLAYVIDARDVTIEQMMQYDQFLLKKVWTFVQHCMPLKFSEVHLINMRRDGQSIFDFVATFLPPKMPFKFILHKKAEDVYDHLPRDAMTVEYGGHNGYQGEALHAWETKLREYTNYFAEDDNYGTNEKLRVSWNNSWEKNDLSGTIGSFRKLNID